MMHNWQINLSEQIDTARPEPLYMQIIQAVIRDIESGRLASGVYLPSSREMARILGVNRKTVVVAYEDLIAQGWLTTTGTRGTRVSTSLPEAPLNKQNPRSDEHTPIAYEFALPPKRPLAIPSGSGLKLDEGSPDGRLFPPELLIRAYRNAARATTQREGFLYRDPRGSMSLRCEIATMLKQQRSLPVTAENICITRGSQNGIYLASQILLKPGDAVIVEELSYEPAIAAFKALGAHVIPVRLDEGGMQVSHMEDLCRKHPVRAVFVTPHHQFPTTVSLRPERRLQLVELSRHYRFAILEDDYDHEFHFETQPLLPIAAYAPDEVIYVGSLSKLLLPALRIGYIAAPKSVIDALAHRVSITDGMGNTLTEDAAALLIQSGELRRHARKARQVYSERRKIFAAEIDRVLGNLVDYRIPDGGLAFWLRFRTDLDQLEDRARAAGLIFASSRSFLVKKDAPRGLRFGFASLNQEELQNALKLLRKAVG